jgi:hypothetical protein
MNNFRMPALRQTGIINNVSGAIPFTFLKAFQMILKGFCIYIC